MNQIKFFQSRCHEATVPEWVPERDSKAYKREALAYVTKLMERATQKRHGQREKAGA